LHTTLPTDIFDTKTSVMEGTIIIASNELRRIIRDEIEAAMQLKKSTVSEEQKRNKRFFRKRLQLTSTWQFPHCVYTGPKSAVPRSGSGGHSPRKS
jgi:hypothetical protein